MTLVSIDNALRSAIAKVNVVQKNQIALPIRDQRLTEQQASKLNDAIRLGWKPKHTYGEWTSGEYGFEPGKIIDTTYSPNDTFTDGELISVIQEAQRPASRHSIAEHIAALAAHKRYNGGAGFTFVQQDLSGYLAEYSELAVKNAFDYFKAGDDSPWFPATADIMSQVRYEQQKLDGLRPRPKVQLSITEEKP